MTLFPPNGIYMKDFKMRKIYLHTKTCPQILATLFLIAKSWVKYILCRYMNKLCTIRQWNIIQH